MSDSDNPFSDPSIRAIVDGASIPSSSEYNPFANTTFFGTNSFRNAPTLPQSSVLPNTPIATADPIRQHIEDLERGQAAIDRSDLSGEMQPPNLNRSSGSSREHNFPPVPACCPFKPCFSQDIQRDIPMAFQKWTTYAFYLWVGLQSAMIINVLAAFACFIAEHTHLLTFILSIVWLFSVGPLSYMLWFRPIYKAFRDNSSMNFMIFFFVFFIHIIFSFLMTIGSFPSGVCGIIIMVQMMGKSGFAYKFAGFLCLLISIILICETLFSIILLIKIHSLYRTTGASLTRAHQEISSNVMSNRNTQRMATQFVASSVTTNMR